MAGPIFAQGGSGIGVHGDSQSNNGVLGTSNSSHGVVGLSHNNTNAGVHGRSRGAAPGVHGLSDWGFGVHGDGPKSTGVFGTSVGGWGVHGRSGTNIGVFGESTGSSGVDGRTRAYSRAAVFGMHIAAEHGSRAWGVSGEAWGNSENSVGVRGWGPGLATGVLAESDRGFALQAKAGSVESYAARFQGRVQVKGDLTVVNGDKPFKIDHPSDPQNKYLLHNAVESPERKNVYDGVAQLDEAGTASVDLPEWFEALNEDFRYQLTAVGQAAPNLHVAEEVYENRFRIAGGEGGMRVCWQVTGSRKDPWAAANPFEVEQEKPQEERGRYLEPSLYDAPEEQSVFRARMGEERLREEPPSVEPPQPPEMPPSVESPQPPEMPSSIDFLRLQQQVDELRGQIEEQRRGRLEEEIDELRGQIKKLRRRRKR